MNTTTKPFYPVSLDSADSDSEEDQSLTEPDLELVQVPIHQVMRPLFIATSSLDDEESDFSTPSMSEMFHGNHISSFDTRCSSGMSVTN